MSDKKVKPTKSGVTDGLSSRINEYRKGEQSSVSEMTSKDFINYFKSHTKRGKNLKSAYNQMVSDMGGFDNISFAQSELARRAAALSVLGMEKESQLAMQDPDFDIEEYIVLTRAQVQVLKSIGLGRKPRKIEKEEQEIVSLEDYVDNSDNEE